MPEFKSAPSEFFAHNGVLDHAISHPAVGVFFLIVAALVVARLISGVSA